MSSQRARLAAFVSAVALTALAPVQALATINVVATIPPVHSLVAGVMQGIGEPTLIIPGGASPHAYAMRPSTARALSDADVVFWVGEAMETFLSDSLETVAAKAQIVELSEAPGVTLLPARESGLFDAHDRDHGGESDDHEHAAAANDHDQDASTDETAAHHHDHGAFDAHIWLSLTNAEHIVDAAVVALSQRDPANAARYAANRDVMREKLDALETTMAAQLAPVRDRPYLVFHDAYQYLEREHDLNIVGSITVDPEQRPGARRLADLRELITDLQGVCVFSEPQFPPDLVRTIVDGTDAKTSELDPVGAGLTPGPDLYFDMMRRMAASLSDCLAER